MQQGSIMHSRKSSKSISATTSVEDAPSVGFHSSSITSYDTWDQDHGKSISSLSQSQPPLMRAVHPTPIINPSSLKPVVLSSKAREFAPEMRYSSIKQNYPLNTSENAGESTPTNYFPTDITMHRSRSGSEGYTVQYTHPPGFTPHAQYPTLSTQSPDNSIFRSCSHDEIDDDIVYPFSSPRTHCFSPKYGAANFGPPTSESIISDISLSEEDFNYFIINNEPPSIQNILNRHPEDEAQIDSILSKIMRTASKPLGVIEHQHTQLTPVIEERRDYRTSSEEYYDTNAL